ncbi:protein TRACHEARY ELEMENT DIFFERENTIATION-RELATED 7A-like [Miscanthus floridulus]|uniref:protein TRACHEARY ELEMENT DIFFERENTIATION-RELATED 7A-like n=1 Tax=Miscanthus floridulus TaxID=154761 RepID=UPI003458F577
MPSPSNLAAPPPRHTPPPSPDHHLAPFIAYDPLFMIPSSSSSLPDIELSAGAHSLPPAARAVKTCTVAISRPRGVDKHIPPRPNNAILLLPPTVHHATQPTQAPNAAHVLGLSLVLAKLMLASTACQPLNYAASPAPAYAPPDVESVTQIPLPTPAPSPPPTMSPNLLTTQQNLSAQAPC